MGNLSDLPRFPISIILAYLQQPIPSTSTSSYQTNGSGTGESPCSNRNNNANQPSFPLPHNRDAISLLLTTKRFAYAILPLFTVPKQVCRNYQYQTTNGTWIAVIEKYRFVVLPIQDPKTLLDRLNTRRLRKRIVWMKKKRLNDIVHQQQCLENGREEDETKDCIEDNISNNNHTNDQTRNGKSNTEASCYQYGRTIEELTIEEWAMMQINHQDNYSSKDTCNNKWRLWPAQLELLHFLDDGNSLHYDDSMRKTNCQGNNNRMISKQRRAIPSPFCFRSTAAGSSKPQRNGTTESPVTNGNNLIMGGQVFGNGIALLASYPRSGNTLLRTLLERISGCVTGSDTRPDRTLSKSLALDHDLVGEGLVGPPHFEPSNNKAKTTTSKKSSQTQQKLYQGAFDPLVHIVKTHFPERKGWKPIQGNKVILLVRNPYDAIDSYWNLCCTNTHTRSLDESVYTKYAQKFEELVKHEIQIWCEFHYYWMDICEKEGVPLLIVRYEDLVLDIETEMMRIMKFLMSSIQTQESNSNDNDVDRMNSFWKWRIQHSTGKASKTKTSTETTNTSNLGSYQPRASSGGLASIGKSIRKRRYSESVLCHMHEIAASMELDRKQNSRTSFRRASSTSEEPSYNKTLLQRFGYDIDTQQFPDNFKQPPPVLSLSHAAVSGKKGTGTVVINKTPEIRSKDDPFGRPMTFWRRGETNGDMNPFPTIPR